jgi:hypothetical protein
MPIIAARLINNNNKYSTTSNDNNKYYNNENDHQDLKEVFLNGQDNKKK